MRFGYLDAQLTYMYMGRPVSLKVHNIALMKLVSCEYTGRRIEQNPKILRDFTIRQGLASRIRFAMTLLASVKRFINSGYFLNLIRSLICIRQGLKLNRFACFLLLLIFSLQLKNCAMRRLIHLHLPNMHAGTAAGWEVYYATIQYQVSINAVAIVMNQ